MLGIRVDSCLRSVVELHLLGILRCFHELYWRAMISGVHEESFAVHSALPASGAESVDVLSAEQLTSAHIAAWSALEERAVEPNAYMSPHFVLPALGSLDPHARAEFWFVQRGTGAGTQLIGACVFVRKRWSRQCPFPHVVAYRSRHSYLSGPLLDRKCAVEALDRMLNFARETARTGMVVVFPCMEAQGPTATMMDNWGKRHGSKLRRTDNLVRSLLVPNQAGPESLKTRLGTKYKEISRNRRRLADAGIVRWHSIRPHEASEAIETFLRLEHTGWKAESKTSLRSSRADEKFFQHMAACFAAEGRLWLTELRLGDEVIASTSNLVSGGAGFAFKVGWNPEFRKQGVGILNEVELVQNAPQVCADLSQIDSGAQPGSFIDALWPGRRELASLIMPLGPAGGVMWRATELARILKRRASGATSTLPTMNREATASGT